MIKKPLLAVEPKTITFPKYVKPNWTIYDY